MKFKEDVFKQFAEMLLEDIKKYGVIDKDGYMYIDDGFNRMLIGKTHPI